MAKAFIFHGTEGYPEENWFPWLKSELEKRGCATIVPQFPTPENQTLAGWFAAISKHEKELGTGTILIGHSLGGAFLLRLLERGAKAKAVFLVGTPIGMGNVKNQKGDDDFTGKAFDWKAIRKNCPSFFVIQSDNDPYVPIENGWELAKNLGVEMLFLPNCGHFNKAVGFTKFEFLLQKIETVLG
ncbi:MAG: alpha/beta fold hydrolase [Candidatus Micrarchaeia archaeon]